MGSRGRRVVSNSMSDVARVHSVLQFQVVEGKDFGTSGSFWASTKVNHLEVWRTRMSDSTPTPYWNHGQCVQLDDTFREVSITVWKAHQAKGTQSRGSKRSGTLDTTSSMGSGSRGTTTPDDLSTSVSSRNLNGLEEQYGRAEVVGKLSLPADFITQDGDIHEDWFTLQIARGEGKVTGSIEMRTMYVKKDDGGVKLTVYLQCGVNLVSRDPNGLSDPFAYVVLIPNDNFAMARKTTVHKETLSPNFQETIEYDLPPDHPYSALYIAVWDWDRFSAPDFMGETIIPFEELELVGPSNRLTVHGLRGKVEDTKLLRGTAQHTWKHSTGIGKGFCIACKQSLSTFVLRLGMKCEKCHLIVHEGCEKFVGGSCGELTRREWFKRRYPALKYPLSRKYEMHILMSQDYLLNEMAVQGYTPGAEVKPHNLVDRSFLVPAMCSKCTKRVLGSGASCSVCGAAFHEECKAKAPELCGAAGRLRIKYRYIREVVLPLKIYQPFMEALAHNDYIAIAIWDRLMTQSKEEVGCTLMRAFQGWGSALPLMRALARREIINTQDANVLFRANSLATKSYDAFFKHVASDYLKHLLMPAIHAIENMCGSGPCEIDETRLPPNTTVEQSVARLQHICDLVLNRLYDTRDKVPLIVRHALADLRAECESAFPDREKGCRTEYVVYTCLSSFFFLRFVCPAVLNPHLFGLSEDVLCESSMRACTLVAKVLQTLANMTSFGEKEAYMTVMNPYMESHRERIIEFLDYESTAPDRCQFGDLPPIDAAKEQCRTLSYLKQILPKMIAYTNGCESEITEDERESIRNVQSVVNQLDEELQKCSESSK